MKKLIFIFLVLLCPMVYSQCSTPPTAPQLSPWYSTNDYDNKFKIEINHQGQSLCANVYILYGKNNPSSNSTNRRFIKPFIFVEGIDFGSQKWTDQNGEFGWCQFWGGDPTEYPMMEKMPNLLNQVWDMEYDIILLDFCDGAEDITKNAMLLVELINRVNLWKNGKEPNVVAGASMGGMVSRYALAYMEKNNMKHCVREYISFDAPHKGANISIGLQHALNSLSQIDVNAKEKKERSLDRPAAMQLLNLHYNQGASAWRTNFVNTLNYYGYPQKLRKVALINGKINGGGQNFNAGDLLLNWDWSPASCASAQVISLKSWAVPGTTLSGNTKIVHSAKLPKNGITTVAPCLSCLNVCCYLCINSNIDFYTNTVYWQNQTSYDNAPGGTRHTAKDFADEIMSSTDFVGNVYHVPEAQAFIPSISGLDINTSNLFFNISTTLTDPNAPHSLYPFEAYYGPTNSNEPHVLVTIGAGSNSQWIAQELERSNRLRSPLVNQTFNFGRREERFLKSLTIGNNGILKVNGSGKTDYNNGPATISNSLFQLETCYCNNMNVDVQNNGRFILGHNSPNNKAIVRFKAGSTLYIRTGGKLIINDNSKLIIEPGARLIYEAGASIELIGDNAVLEINGELHIGNNAIFTFTYPNNANSGFVKFGMPGHSSHNVLVGTNSSIKLRGKAKEDKILEITQESLYLPSNLALFELFRGKAELGNNSRINAGGSEIRIVRSLITSTNGYNNSHRGIKLFGNKATITFSTFENGNTGIEAQTFYGGNPLVITDSYFNNCYTGVLAYGTGVKISSSHFNDNNTGIGMSGQIFESIITNCRFENNTYGIIGGASPTAPVKIINTNINAGLDNNQIGLEVENGTTYLKCSTIKNYTFGVHTANNSVFNSSTLSGGGYSTLSENEYPIYLTKAVTIYLEEGNNKLIMNDGQKCFSHGLGCKVRISGTLDGCSSPGIIYANTNQWSELPQNFRSSFGDIQTSCNNNVILQDNSPGATKPCGFFDPPAPPPVPIDNNSSALRHCPSCTVISTIDFNQVKLNEAVIMAMKKLDESIVGSKAHAFSLFRQILNFPVPNPTKDEKYLHDLSYRWMQEALGKAVEMGEVNAVLTEPSIQDLISIQNKKLIKAGPLDNENYYQHLFFNMDKANIFRLTNRRDLAISKYNEILLWAHIEDHPFIERWKCYTEAEENALTGTISSDGFNTQVAMCNLENKYPSLLNISRKQNESYPEMITMDIMESEKLKTGLKVYPNPVSNTLNISFILFEECSVSIELLNVAGMPILKLKGEELYQKGEHLVFFNTEDIPSGVYFVRFKTESEVILEKVVVLK